MVHNDVQELGKTIEHVMSECDHDEVKTNNRCLNCGILMLSEDVDEPQADNI